MPSRVVELGADATFNITPVDVENNLAPTPSTVNWRRKAPTKAVCLTVKRPCRSRRKSMVDPLLHLELEIFLPLRSSPYFSIRAKVYSVLVEGVYLNQ
mmetsp:Transcript_14146/g.34039  ORF Transcript_14146/g.34039 Transcript_14146/m.34039 type:complete len:98 (+) Transcript_14146:3153-3446(+)